MAVFQIIGKVINSRTKEGIQGLNVQVWDKDLLIDDFVGSTVTKEGGLFKIQFDESNFNELFLDRRPDLFFKVFKESLLIKSTEDSILWNEERDHIEQTIEVDKLNMNTGLKYRSNNAPKGTTKVVVFPVGARLQTAGGNTYIVDAGHSFCVKDKVLRISAADIEYSGIDAVKSVTATTITMQHSVSGRRGDKLVNLCHDQGTSAPTFEGSKMRIFSDQLGTSLITSAILTKRFSSYGYEYYHKGGGRAWELCINAQGKILCIHTGFNIEKKLYLPDFGLAGDGITNDREPMFAAINAISCLRMSTPDTLLAWPDDSYRVDGEKEVKITIKRSNLTLDFKGACMTGNHRIIFDGESVIDGDRSAMLTNVHVKNLTLIPIGKDKCPKAPRMNWCKDSSMINVTKNGKDGTGFNLLCCQRVTLRNCHAIQGNEKENTIGFLIHLCDDTIVEDCTIDGRDHDTNIDYPVYYGLQIKGGYNNIVRRCKCINLKNPEGIPDRVNSCFRDRGDAPWHRSKTVDERDPPPTYPYSRIEDDECSEAELWECSDIRRASHNTVFSDCIVENCDGHAYYTRESINTLFERCHALDSTDSTQTEIHAGFRFVKRDIGEESGMTVSCCTVKNYLTGVSISTGADDNLFGDCVVEHSRIKGSRKMGIEIDNTTNFNVRDCLVLNTRGGNGINIKGANNSPQIHHCVSSETRAQITRKQTKGISVSTSTVSATINDCICLNNVQEQIDDKGLETTLSNNVTNKDRFTTLEINDSSPSVKGLSLVKTANTKPTHVTDFLDGIENQTITVLIDDINTSILENPKISLYEGIPIGSKMLNLTFTLTLRLGIWVEERRIGF